MPIYEQNGSVLTEIGKIYELNGGLSHEINKAYEVNAGVYSEVYSGELPPYRPYWHGVNYSSSHYGSWYKNEQTTYGGYPCWWISPWSGSYSATAAIRSNTAVDFTGRKQIRVEAYTISGYGSSAASTPRVCLFVSPVANQALDARLPEQDSCVKYIKTDIATSWKNFYLDVTGLTGSYYFGVGLFGAYDTAQMFVYDLELI